LLLPLLRERRKMRRRLARRRVLTLLCVFLVGPAAAAKLTGKSDIVDGDTIKVGGITVRLYGIDAPESRQTCKRDGRPMVAGNKPQSCLLN
jgi:endonuclease YncB( thermonuclease family)